MKDEGKRRVVISGLGVVAPNAIGQDAFWHATANGISGITHLPQAATQMLRVAGIVRNFVIEDYIERKLAHRSDRMTHFVFAAMQEALTDACLEMALEQPSRVGAVIANTMGGAEYVLKQLHTLYTRGPRFMSAFTAIAWLHVSNVGQAAIHYGLQGYCKTPVNDTVGGLDALGMAYTALQRGVADVIITGGCEAFLHPFILHVLAQQGQYVTEDDPCAYRPFDRRACGLVPAEGAGICILEDYEHARQRGAPIYAEIVGYAQTNDAHGMFAPSADGTRYARAIRQVMQEGHIAPADIAYVSLDGRAIPTSDQGEAEALHTVFGAELAHIALSVPRTMLGHSYAAAGAIDVITALLALKHGCIPPTMNCEQIDTRYGLQLVQDHPQPLARAQTSDVVLLGGRGLGGANVALAVRKVR